MAYAWGPVSQRYNTDLRWTVWNFGHGPIILTPRAFSANCVVRSHDPGSYQPRLDRPQPHPDYFTSVVVENPPSSNPYQLYLFGIG